MIHKNLFVLNQSWTCYTTGILVGLCFSLVAPRADAASFSITPIATTGSEFTNLSAGIAINDQGVVSFVGDTSSGRSVFTGNGNTTTSIFNSASLSTLPFQSPNIGAPPSPFSYSLGSDTAINNTGSLLFTAVLRSESSPINSRLEGLFKITDGIITRIGDPLSSFSFSSGSLSDTQSFSSFTLNDQGDVVASVFRSQFTPRNFQQTQILLNGVIIDGGATGASIPPSSVSSPDINNQGQAFYYRSQSSFFPFPPVELNNIIQVTNGTRTFVVNEPVFTNNLAVNNQAQIAFSGSTNSQFGVFVVNNGVPTRVFTGSAGPVDINNAGTIAFQGTDRSPSGDFLEGIFVRSDNSLDRIISLGDALLGSPITQLRFPRAKGLNNQGQITFYAELANGTKGIFRADPIAAQVPESGMILGLATLAGLGLQTRRRRVTWNR